MELFTYNHYQVKLDPQALAIKVFRDIWKRDNDPEKWNALQELSWIYFMEDARSDYSYLTNPDERSAKIIDDMGMKGWKPDKLVLKAQEYYRSIQPPEVALLTDMLEEINQIRADLKKLDVFDANDPIAAMKKKADLLAALPKLILNVKQTKETIYQILIEQAQARGSVELTLMDEDLDMENF